MNEKENYAEYCEAHLDEFVQQLREDANRALMSWPARSASTLMFIASLITFYYQGLVGNDYAEFSLLTYLPAILIVVTYPFVSLLSSSAKKLSPIFFDALCLFGVIGFCLAVWVIILGDFSQEALDENFRYLQGQVAFVIGLGTAFSFHPSYLVTLIRNLIFTIIVSSVMFFASEEFFFLNGVAIIEGVTLGVIINWVFFDGMRARFYLKSTDADTRQHLYNQLSKLVYPHQLERIKLGDELENTMPLKEGKAIINVFDVQRSSDIRHEKTAEFFMNLFQAFLQICMKGYEHNPLRSQAFRLKETGDGFISSVGYPFLPVDSRSLADSAVSTALSMFEAFNQEVERFNYSRPIKGAMGLAYNSVQGTFQSGGIRSYDLFGEALIQASKYEELRKQPAIWNIFCDHAKQRGFEDFNILIAQEVVYNSLSPAYRELFTEIDLGDKEIVGDFQMLYDNDARFLYFHLLA